ncbi:MAG: glycogen synthase [Streptomycetaceae bacterium]|nr:MAG: glycogen synthase [Streptomycetaceae bacterium]
MKVGLVTKEWPPHVYGGAGVHVVQLAQALRRINDVEVDVFCFGEERADAQSFDVPAELISANPATQAMAIDLLIAQSLSNVSLVHSHTWYANMAGHLASILHGIPHVMSAHSLEPLRPWKAEQLGGGYQLSSWIEKSAIESAAAVIAVSDGMKADLLAAYPSVDPAKVVTIRNGVDTHSFAPNNNRDALERYAITGRYALFVGRITRQKGLAHLLRAWDKVPADYGLVIAAGSPDEPAIGDEIASLIRDLQKTRKNIWWVEKMMPHEELTAVLTAADLFICPSIYEPLGIVNLEAMACSTAVLASAVGGIPEVVNNGVTGELVEYSTDSQQFENRLSQSISRLMSDPDLLVKYGAAGRLRAEKEFGWDSVATDTINLYSKLLK